MKDKENFLKELDEMEVSNSSDGQFRVMIIRVLKNMQKDIETIKKDQSERKNAMSEINNILEGINSRLGKQRIKSVFWKTR